jgi:hypothetical protein
MVLRKRQMQFPADPADSRRNLDQNDLRNLREKKDKCVWPVNGTSKIFLDKRDYSEYQPPSLLKTLLSFTHLKNENGIRLSMMIHHIKKYLLFMLY